MISPARKLIQRPGYEDARRRFIQQLPRVLGTTPVAGYLPHRDDLLTSVCPWSGRIWTAGATVSGQLRPFGLMTQRSFASASTQFGTTPDTANMSFGNAVTDQPFSVLVLANVTNTAADRNMMAKWIAAGNLREWELIINSTDTLRMILADGTTNILFADVASDAAITQGVPALFAGTYSGVGGASAHTGVTLYQNGVALAATGSTTLGYVAMTDKTSAPEIGSVNAGTGNFFDGSIGLTVVVAGEMAAARIAGATGLCRQFFGAPL